MPSLQFLLIIKKKLLISENEGKNAGHYMAIFGEPCNDDAHTNNPGLFMTMLCPRQCVRLYCTPVHTDCDCTVVLLTNQSIASIQRTPHTHDTHTQDTKSDVELGFPDYKECSMCLS